MQVNSEFYRSVKTVSVYGMWRTLPLDTKKKEIKAFCRRPPINIYFKVHPKVIQIKGSSAKWYFRRIRGNHSSHRTNGTYITLSITQNKKGVHIKHGRIKVFL